MSVSFCHYKNEKTKHNLIPLDTLKEGILYGMKENLNIQFVYSDYELPKEYKEIINTIDHIDIKPININENADVLVIEGVENINSSKICTCVVCLTKTEFFINQDRISELLERIDRLNVVLTDIETFTEEDFGKYTECLVKLSDKIEQLYVLGMSPQLNLLTDRMMLEKMNNCGAGDTNITLAPNGKFYICPAFYLSNDGYDIGNLSDGLDIKNPQLYKLDYAPLCRCCDAYQCKRCVWLNRKTTCELNTPSHEQCVVAHIERNASRTLLSNIRKHGEFLPEKKEIEAIDYMDPFEVRKKW